MPGALADFDIRDGLDPAIVRKLNSNFHFLMGLDGTFAPASSSGGSGGSGASDYEELDNLPSIDGTTLIGDRSHSDIGVNIVTDQSIDTIVFG